MTLPRNLLLVLALKLTTAAVINDAPPTYGFFGRTEGTTSDTTTSSSSTTTTTTTTTKVEECTGFGCREDASLSQDDADRGERGFHQSLGSCTPVSLELTTDGRPQDVSFELTCNDSNIWTYPSALIPSQGAHGQIRVSACVFLDHSCCHFALHDSHGEGLSSGTADEDDSSTMLLQVDGRDVLKYNSQHDLPFTTLARSFGKTCDATPQINVTPKDMPQDVDCQMGVDRPLNFRITLDEHPEDLSWFLVCQSDSDKDDELVTVWDTPRGSLAGHVGQVAAEKACIPYDSTCSFTIVDAAGDGLSKGSGYTLTLGVGLIDAYVSEPFQEKSYCIGPKCNDNEKSSDVVVEEEEETATEAPEEQDLSLEEPEEEEPETVSVHKMATDEEEDPGTESDVQEMKDEFEQELEKLEDQEEKQEMLLEELRESNELRQQEIELLQEELQEEEALEKKVEQEQQQQQTPPPQPKEQEADAEEQQVHDEAAAAENNNTEDLLLQEEVETLAEEERSFEAWILAGLGIVAILFVAVAGVALNMSSNRHSVAVRVALSPMKNGMLGLRTADTDDESTEPDDHTFCLDA